jgi:hypothetical protein
MNRKPVDLQVDTIEWCHFFDVFEIKLGTKLPEALLDDWWKPFTPKP